jgi:hypothetical protein
MGLKHLQEQAPDGHQIEMCSYSQIALHHTSSYFIISLSLSSIFLSQTAES